MFLATELVIRNVQERACQGGDGVRLLVIKHPSFVASFSITKAALLVTRGFGRIFETPRSSPPPSDYQQSQDDQGGKDRQDGEDGEEVGLRRRE